MSKPDPLPDLTTLPASVLEDMERDGNEPVFNEPWEAQAFAMTVHLHAKGLFTWAQWATALSSEIHGGEERGYYSHWLAALEKLVAESGLVSLQALETREQEWHEAAARTPHGEPIELTK